MLFTLSLLLFSFQITFGLVKISSRAHHFAMKRNCDRISTPSALCMNLLITSSTVVSPPKVDKTKKKSPLKDPEAPGIFKENRDIQQEFENYGDDDLYKVILYNDPFNKRIYVAQCLMEVFCWTEDLAGGKKPFINEKILQ